jgi:hypothetical protein
MKRKNIIKTKESSLLDILNPMMNYLISIENNPISDTESFLVYTLGVPKNWIMETDVVYCSVLKDTPNLKLIKLEQSPDTNLSIDEFYNYIVNLINKNLMIDQKRIELELEINKLKSKFQVEQQELMNDLFNPEEKILEENGEELAD